MTTIMDEDVSLEAAPTTVLCGSGLVNGHSNATYRTLRLHDADAGGPLRLPAQTNAWCWHCAGGFDTPPFPLPVSYEATTGAFEVMGNFCSNQCAAAWAIDRRLHQEAQTFMLLNLLSAQMGLRTPVKPAPPAQVLQHFGGPMTLEAFRNNGGGDGSGGQKPARITCITPPLISFPTMLEGLAPDEKAAAPGAPVAPVAAAAVARSNISTTGHLSSAAAVAAQVAATSSKSSASLHATSTEGTTGLYHAFLDAKQSGAASKHQRLRSSSAGATSAASALSAAEGPFLSSSSTSSQGGPLAQFISPPKKTKRR